MKDKKVFWCDFCFATCRYYSDYISDNQETEVWCKVQVLFGEKNGKMMQLFYTLVRAIIFITIALNLKTRLNIASRSSHKSCPLNFKQFIYFKYYITYIQTF